MNRMSILFLALAACGTGTTEPDPDTGDTGGTAASGYAVVTTVAGDYTTGSFATINLDDWTVSDDLFVTSGDPAVASSGDAVFQINRFGYDTIRSFTPGEWLEPSWEKELEDASNPQDAVICGDDLFVSLFETDALGVYDPATGNLAGTVDLSAFADTDASPEAASLAVIGDSLYVGLQRLNRTGDFWTDDGAIVAEVDCATRAVTDSWDVGGNTSIAPLLDTDSLLVWARNYDKILGGLYVLDPTAGELSSPIEITGEEIQGAAGFGDKAIAFSLAQDYSHYALHCIDLATGDVTSTETDEYYTAIRAHDNGEAWLTLGSSWLNAEAPTGVRVFDIATCAEKTTEPIALSLFPTSVAFY